MARKRKKRTGRRSRRRGSAIGQVDMTGLMYSGLGGLAARLIDRVLPSTWDPKIVAAGKIGLGFALPMLSKDANTKKVLSSVGAGMVTVGVVDGVQAFGFMQGIGQPPKPSDVTEFAVAIEGASEKMGADVLGADVLGAGDIPVINAVDDLPVINASSMDMQDRMIMA